MDPRELKTGEPFSGLFPIDPATRDAILGSMKERGFDPSKAIDVWRQTGLALDGHTRLGCALEIGTADVPVFFHDFASEEEALKYAIANQRDRRNITGADIARCVLAVDARKPEGRPAKTTSMEVVSGRSAVHTAAIVGTSRKTVERVRVIADHAKEDPKPLEDVLQGKETIRMAERKISDKKRREKKVEPFVPAATPAPPKPKSPAKLQHSPEDEAWLSSFPLRSKVATDRFDEDALIYRRFAPFFNEVKPTLLALIGRRSPGAGMSLLHLALHQISDIMPIERWETCIRCKGSGENKGICRSCRGGGFVIPGL